MERLTHEYNLIKILHHRNKNQHRASVWWKSFNSLKRSLTTIVLRQANVDPKLVYKLKNHLIPQCYRQFHNIVALAQFVTLGMVLLGLLARVNSCVDSLCLEYGFHVSKKRTLMPLKDDHAMETADDIGEAIDLPSVPVIPVSTVIKKGKNKKDKPKKKIKRKKTSAIDDIFG